jgi:UDP-2,4-diacetamido-2,4,6-trideoxy-beta-L-altropyranose hydrolase
MVSVFMIGNLVIRVDADLDIGMGHFMRCLALAQAWQRCNGNVSFVMTGDQLRERVDGEGMNYCNVSVEPGSMDDAGKLVKHCESFNTTWIIVDGYHFNMDYHMFLKERGFNLLIIDDEGKLDYYIADIILNQNLHASPDLYNNRSESTILLLGTDYVLLRKEFLEWMDWKREFKTVSNHLLITLGGSDKNNYTLKIIDSLETLSYMELEVIVLVGVNNPHINVLREAFSKSNLKIDLMQNVSDMPRIMARADLAFSSGGITVWEMAFMGLPTIVGATSPVEELLIEGLNKYNLFRSVGKIDEIGISELSKVFKEIISNQEKRKFMSDRGKNFVDGYGVDRVIKCMHKKKQ